TDARDRPSPADDEHRHQAHAPAPRHAPVPRSRAGHESPARASAESDLSGSADESLPSAGTLARDAERQRDVRHVRFRFDSEDPGILLIAFTADDRRERAARRAVVSERP